MSEYMVSNAFESNVSSEKNFRIRVTFLTSGTSLSFRSQGATIKYNSATGQYLLSFPEAYTEITHFSYGWAPAGTTNAPLTCLISTNNVTAGTATLTLGTGAPGASFTAAAPNTNDVLFLDFGVSRDTLNGSFVGTG